MVFSFDRSNMQIFIVNIARVVWPHVTNLLDLRYFCQHNPLFYHLNLIPCHYWSWQRNIYFLVNIFVRHTFFMSKSSIKTKTILTMTVMTESTELLALFLNSKPSAISRSPFLLKKSPKLLCQILKNRSAHRWRNTVIVVSVAANIEIYCVLAGEQSVML